MPVLLLPLFLQGCMAEMSGAALNDATAPYCDGLHEIQSIESAWRSADGTLQICLRGVPVAAVADPAGISASQEETLYSATIPADILYRQKKLDEWRWLGMSAVRLPAERTRLSCLAPQPDWTPVAIESAPADRSRRVPHRRAGQTYRGIYRLDQPGLAVFNVYDSAETAGSYSPPRAWDQTMLIVRRAGDDASESRLAAYRLLQPRGEIRPGKFVEAGGLLLYDTIFLATGVEWDEEGEKPVQCLPRN